MDEGREQPVNQIIVFRLEDGRVVESSIEELPEDAYSEPDEEAEREEVEGEELPPSDKIHPVLQTMMDERPDDRELIVISMLDDMTLPRFPDPVTDEPRESAANMEVARRTEELIADITDRRAESYEQLSQELAENYAAEILETFWLAKVMMVVMPLSRVPDIAEREDVLYIQPNVPGAMPDQVQPGNSNTLDDVDDGRASIGTDSLFGFGVPGVRVGLLDTGILSTHTLFAPPSNVGLLGDCVNGGEDCRTGSNLNPTDDCFDHGTGVGAIISGNGNLGNPFRGVSASPLDSWKISSSVFDPVTKLCTGVLPTDAILRAFQQAVRAGDRVICGAFGDPTANHFSALSLAADSAYELGAAVLHSNGNAGPGITTVGAPANAHKAIGVGAFDVQTRAQQNSQSRGPTGDGRFKPDIQAPTNSETASNISSTALTPPPLGFGGTSGAVPYAAGAAALLRSFLTSLSPSGIGPGHVYAYLILWGQARKPFDNTRGAGRLFIRPILESTTGGVVIRSGQTVSIPFEITSADRTRVDSAIWWADHVSIHPQAPRDLHSKVELDLLDPAGTQVDTSTDAFSVFQKVRARAPIAPGTWSLDIRADRVFHWGGAPLPVYFALVAS